MKLSRCAAVAVPVLVTATVLGAGAPAGALPKPVGTLVGQDWRYLKAVSVSGGPATSVTVTCPAGMQVTGAGGRITGIDVGRVTIDDIAPDPALMGATVTAAVHDSTWDPSTDTFTLEATARCVRTTALPTAAAVVTGLTLVSGLSTSNGTSDSPKTAVARCPFGKTLYGTGFEVNGGDGNVLVNAVVPDAALTSVTVTAYNANPFDPYKPFTGTWDLAAFAVCGTSRGQDALTQATSANDGVLEKSIQAPACPSGTLLTGAGMNLDDHFPWTSIVAPVTMALAPFSSTESPLAAPTTYNRASVAGSGFLTDAWSATAYSLCH